MNADADIQQRATEYLAVISLGDSNPKLMEEVFHVMPDFPERESMLMRRLNKATKERTGGGGAKKKDKDGSE